MIYGWKCDGTQWNWIELCGNITKKAGNILEMIEEGKNVMGINEIWYGIEM